MKQKECEFNFMSKISSVKANKKKEEESENWKWNHKHEERKTHFWLFWSHVYQNTLKI